MGNVSPLDILTAVAATGSFGILGVLAVRIYSGIPKFMEQWLAHRAAKAAEKAADWSRLRDLLSDQGGEIKRLGEDIQQSREEIQRSREAERQCEEELADKERRIARLEGFNAGRGEARQEVAIIESAKRIVDENGKP